MIRPSLLALALASWAMQTIAAAADRVGFEERTDGLAISIGGQAVATYVYKDKVITRPYLAHVRTLDGIQVTRNHPPHKEDLQDHATMHPGIWLAFGDLGGHDYWRLKAKVVHDGFLQKPSGGEGRGGFAVRNRYLSADGKTTVCTEVCRLGFHLRPAGCLIVWDSTFSSDAGDFSFGDQEEMGLGVRLATPLAVASKRGGRTLDSEGRRDESGIWGKQATWCDYSGIIERRRVGVTLMPDPGNFRPSWWHVRDYGLMVANPFGRAALTGGERSHVVVHRGDLLRLRFGLLLHSQEAAKPDLAAAYGDFLAVLEEDDAAAGDAVLRYVRPSGKTHVPESEVRIQHHDRGYVVTSITQRPNVTLTLTSRYDLKHRLSDAKVVTDSGKQSQSATATVENENAHVRREKSGPRMFNCPAGVIVTSAPDWTDAVLAVRRYDRQGKTTQEFPGLWIHPAQEPQRLTFKLTRQSEQTVTHDGRKVTLTRFLLELRGGSRYTVWGDPQRRLIRLAPEGKAGQGIILSGWAEATKEMTKDP